MTQTEHAFDGNGFCQIHGGYCSMAEADPRLVCYRCRKPIQVRQEELVRDALVFHRKCAALR